jgi:hypothetical protein
MGGHGPQDISPAALDALRNRVSSKEPEDQWFEVWRIIFPNDEEPDNPYVGTLLEEAVSMLGVFWVSDAPKILPDFMERRGVSMEWEKPLKGLLTDLLEHVQEYLKSADVAAAPPPDDNIDAASLPSRQSSMSLWTEQSSFSEIARTPSSSSMYGSPPEPRQVVDMSNFFHSAADSGCSPMDDALVLSTGSLDASMMKAIDPEKPVGLKQDCAEPHFCAHDCWLDSMGQAAETYNGSIYTEPDLGLEVAEAFYGYRPPDQAAETYDVSMYTEPDLEVGEAFYGSRPPDQIG